MKLVCFDMEGVLFDSPGKGGATTSIWHTLFEQTGAAHQHQKTKRDV